MRFFFSYTYSAFLKFVPESLRCQQQLIYKCRNITFCLKVQEGSRKNNFTLTHTAL